MTEWGQPFVPNVRQPTVLLPATASVLPRELSGVSCVASCVVLSLAHWSISRRGTVGAQWRTPSAPVTLQITIQEMFVSMFCALIPYVRSFIQGTYIVHVFDDVEIFK